MALTDNIQGYWKFDETSGDAADSTANGNDLTNNNAASYVPAVINNGVDLERASTQWMSIADASQTGLDFSAALTFAGWVKFESFDTTVSENRDTLVFKYLNTGNQRSYFLGGGGWSGGSGNLNFACSSDGANSGASQVGVAWQPSLATWYHVAVTKSATTTVKFYVDGAQFGTDQTLSNSGAIFDSTTAFQMGRFEQSSNTTYLDGIMDEWGVWSRALTDAEIDELYNNGAGLSYPFTGGGGGAVRDSRFLNLLGVG